MTVVTGFTVSSDEIVFGQALAGTETRIELTQFVPVDEQFIPYFWKERDGDTEQFEQTARDHPAVADLTNLDGRVESALYRIDWTDEADGFLDGLREQDILVEEAVTNHGDEWSFRLRAFDQGELSAFQSICNENDIHLDIYRMVHNPEPSDGTDDRALIGVTDKQQQALRLALERGYFNVPRDVSADELGEELGVTGQAVSNYCEDCEWSASTDNCDRQELAGLAIEHATEFGHDIDSELQ